MKQAAAVAGPVGPHSPRAGHEIRRSIRVALHASRVHNGGRNPPLRRSASGQLDATTIMYQHLPPTATKLPGSGV